MRETFWIGGRAPCPTPWLCPWYNAAFKQCSNNDRHRMQSWVVRFSAL